MIELQRELAVRARGASFPACTLTRSAASQPKDERLELLQTQIRSLEEEFSRHQRAHREVQQQLAAEGDKSVNLRATNKRLEERHRAREHDLQLLLSSFDRVMKIPDRATWRREVLNLYETQVKRMQRDMPGLKADPDSVGEFNRHRK